MPKDFFRDVHFAVVVECWPLAMGEPTPTTATPLPRPSPVEATAQEVVYLPLERAERIDNDEEEAEALENPRDAVAFLQAMTHRRGRKERMWWGHYLDGQIERLGGHRVCDRGEVFSVVQEDHWFTTVQQALERVYGPAEQEEICVTHDDGTVAEEEEGPSSVPVSSTTSSRSFSLSSSSSSSSSSSFSVLSAPPMIPTTPTTSSVPPIEQAPHHTTASEAQAGSGIGMPSPSPSTTLFVGKDTTMGTTAIPTQENEWENHAEGTAVTPAHAMEGLVGQTDGASASVRGGNTPIKNGLMLPRSPERKITFPHPHEDDGREGPPPPPPPMPHRPFAPRDDEDNSFPPDSGPANVWKCAIHSWRCLSIPFSSSPSAAAPHACTTTTHPEKQHMEEEQNEEVDPEEGIVFQINLHLPDDVLQASATPSASASASASSSCASSSSSGGTAAAAPWQWVPGQTVQITPPNRTEDVAYVLQLYQMPYYLPFGDPISPCAGEVHLACRMA